MASPSPEDKPVVLESLDGYTEHRHVLDTACRLPHGQKLPVTLASPQEAVAFRMRCYDFRKADRRNNAKLYPPGHDLWGRSSYDAVVLTLPVGSSTILVYVPLPATIGQPQG